jgi:hypothetical protein
VTVGVARSAVPRRGRNYRYFPGWVSDHRAMQALQTWLTLGSLVAVVVLVAAGPQRRVPEPMTAATLVSWPWLLVWSAIATALAAPRLWCARRRRRWRRNSRDGQVDSMSRAMSLAEDMLQPRSLSQDALWCTVAVKPLAALIYAASPQGNGLGWPWLATLTGRLCDEQSADGWDHAAAAATEVDASLCRWVSAMGRMDARQRASVGVTIHSAVVHHVGPLR